MRCSSNLWLLLAVVLAACETVGAQAPDYKNVGRTPTQEEIQAWDLTVLADGTGLPPGSGTAKQGAAIFAQKCFYCHGPTGEEGPGPRVSRDANSVPVATTIFDFIRRAMPMDREESLTADEVYSLVAWIFYRNHIIQEDDVMDAKSLPKVQMPNRDGFFPAVNTGWDPKGTRPNGVYH
jgi:cytochrome c